jgi:17beta-estradiol 17-dehydrogenase / very-long-chain 3-oxoacyl-CoA reductase
MGPLEVLGLVFAGYWSIRIILYLSRFFQTGADVAKLGDWAVITGATDGIGKGFAKELASKGINIVLVSRTLSKLQDVAKELEEKYKVKTRVIAVDFTEADSVYDKISQGIQGLEGSIGVLVNNVGMSYNHPEFYLQIDDLEKFNKDIVSMNVCSVLNATRAVMPQMVERKRGAVLNISSSSSLHSCPLLTVYAATKAFVNHFTQDMQVEYKSKGIIVQAFAPYYVVSKLSKMKSSSFFVPTPETYAKSALSSLGLCTVGTGYWPHDLMLFGLNILGVIGIQGPHVLKNLAKIRKRALARKEKSN